MAEPAILSQRERELAARAKAEKAAREQRKRAILARGGSVAEADPGPSTVSDAIYDMLARGIGAGYRAAGSSPRDAAQSARGKVEGLRAITDDLLGVKPIEEAVVRIAKGQGRPMDYAMAGLAVAPIAAKPLVRGTRAAKWLTKTRPIKEADDAVEAAFRVVGDGTPRLAAPKAKPGAARPVPRASYPSSQLADLTVKPAGAIPYAPRPQLPEGASKPRGGQWFPDADLMLDTGGRVNLSPEAAARMAAEESRVFGAEDAATRDWFTKAYAKYLRNDFGAPGDPLRALADRGLNPNADSGDVWTRVVDDYLGEDEMGWFTVPGEAGQGPIFNQSLAEAAPWLKKQPVTDKLYSFQGAPDNGHILDELSNALNPASGLPPELLINPNSLGRMSYPQLVERVGQIGQWRAEQEVANNQALANNAAVHLFKEYPENNPRGLRWVELRAPEGGDTAPLKDALKYEGDVMGHCVGGYCDSVAQGQSRIFSLRDARGEPHVTIETAPSHASIYDTNVVPREVWAQAEREAGDSQSAASLVRQWARDNLNLPDSILQVKGKQNKKPKDEYLPFVQDFVESGAWHDIGDFHNTGMLRLPSGRVVSPSKIAAEPIGIPELGDVTYGDLQAAHNRMAEARGVEPYLENGKPLFDWDSMLFAAERNDPELWQALAPYLSGGAR